MSARRYQIFLPIVLLLVAVVLNKVGDFQMGRLERASVDKYGFMEHPLPQDYAMARYLDYGLNAPAWLLSVKMPFLFSRQERFSCCGFMRSEKDWEYLILVVVMWYIIGGILDRRRTYQDRSKTSQSSIWRNGLARVLCGLYGAFLCYSVLEFYQPPWNYPRWFVVPLALWGVAMILASVYPVSPVRAKNWYRVLAGFVAVAGVFYIEAGTHLYEYRALVGAWSVAMFFCWGMLAMVGSAYLFRVSTKLQNHPNLE
jgi:hypothetical protein